MLKRIDAGEVADGQRRLQAAARAKRRRRRSSLLMVLTRRLRCAHALRQQNQRRRPGIPNFALADFVAPKDSGHADYLGLFAVTTGLGGDDRLAAFEKAGDDYNAIMFKALADRLAEAFAEHLHERAQGNSGAMRTTNISTTKR